MSKSKVQFNCRLEETVRDSIVSAASPRGVSQADVIELAVAAYLDPAARFTPEIEKRIAAQVKPRRQSKKAAHVEALKSSDITAQAVERNDIEYGEHTELPRGENVATMKSARGIRPKGDKTR